MIRHNKRFIFLKHRNNNMKGININIDINIIERLSIILVASIERLLRKREAEIVQF
jgi:hypothetical protein